MQTAQQFDADYRRSIIGCSELGAVLGVDQWKTPLDVFNEKLGLVAPFEGNKHTRRGQRLEHIAAEEYTEITGQKLRRMTRELKHPDHEFIRGHIDRLLEGQNKVVEIKVVSVAAFRKLQREGLPDSWIVQMQSYIGLGQYDGGVFIIFCPDQFEVIFFDIQFDQAIYDAAVNAAVSFWTNHVLTQQPPAAVAADKPTLEFEKVGGDLVIREDDAFREWAERFREAKSIKDNATELYDALVEDFKTKIVEDVPGKYQGFGVRVAYTESAGRKTFDKKALAATYPDIDLSQFDKQGQPFKTFRPYIISE
ncbi:YqaJ viral recombinase family protein [Geitlerinema calcuttense]|uniref:YqaJ viral recombinase family protein n=1 Tax=Geitlerinema calcuttense NRMC-F 0142 TaxID=2922238 RepID=A0ABT7LW05_9CYAN|nr:YqaJ viral recombinase family protein [Geitlerinema calcuttense]MDL5055919.1 YqaJ viral recombinase family protein [Geitlerinema calcuttense NRMC-F 0142]